MRTKSLLKLSALLFSILTTMAVTPSLHAAVWETKAQWDDAAEANFRTWVHTKWKQDYFQQEGPMKDTVMDCADAIYAMRILFSAENGLPFAMKDPTSRKSPILSNEMTRWDDKEPALRLRAFMQLIYMVSSTASMPADTYPTAIGPQTLGSGSIILTDPLKHHSWTIQSFSQTGIPYLLFASRPARTLLYERNEYPSVGFVFPEGIRPETNAGFRNFRQPAYVGKPVAEVPGFSLEQYDIPPEGFFRTVQKRMQKSEETNQQQVARLFKEACRGARERVDIVRDALKRNKSLGDKCMSQVEYDDNSTPSRDMRMRDSFTDLARAYKEALTAHSGAMNAATKKATEAVLTGSAIPADATCMVEIAPGNKLTLGQIYTLSINDKLSNNPHDPLEVRWGLAPGPSAKASTCPVY